MVKYSVKPAGNTKDSWGIYYDRALHLDKVENRKRTHIFSCEVDGMRTCAWSELCNFEFHGSENEEYSEELQKAFNKYVKTVLKTEMTGDSLVMFNLNRGWDPQAKEEKKIYQPDWFIKCLQNHPNLIWEGPWTVNKTHRPENTKVKPYVLAL